MCLLLLLLQVAAYVRTRTLDEVLLMVKEHQGASSTRMKAQEDWKGAAKKRAEVTSEADTRSAAFTDVEVSVPLVQDEGGRGGYHWALGGAQGGPSWEGLAVWEGWQCRRWLSGAVLPCRGGYSAK